jgi:integrase
VSADPQPATTAVPRQANPLRTSAFRALRDTCCSSSPIDRRDRALLLIGLASALRRAELAALTVADLDYVEEGVRLYIARSKTDQAAGQIVAWSPAPRPAP